MSEASVTIRGNLASTPVTRLTSAGAPVTSFRVASTPRYYDRAAGEWRDGETLFLTVVCWRALAENVAASLVKGDGVVLTGRLVQRNYQTKDGEPRVQIEVEASTVGPDLTRGHSRLFRRPREAADGQPENGQTAPAGIDPSGRKVLDGHLAANNHSAARPAADSTIGSAIGTADDSAIDPADESAA